MFIKYAILKLQIKLHIFFTFAKSKITYNIVSILLKKDYYHNLIYICFILLKYFY